jgi:hypothetical protein
MSEQISITSAYTTAQPKIDESTKKIEQYRDDFNKIVEDPGKLFDLAKKVFSEDRYKQFRYSGADVQRALEGLGYPQVGVVPPLSFADIAELCTKFLTEPDKRFDLARQLLLFLPEYVDQGKNMEAHLILNTAYRMVESPVKINLFLYEMFRYGWEEWESEIESRRKAFLRELGTDMTHVSKMSLDEAEAMVGKLVSDPEKKSRLLAFYTANPSLIQHDAAQALELEQAAVYLLMSDLAGPLHLQADEVKPWLTDELIGKLQPLGAKARTALTNSKENDFNAISEKITDIMIEVAMDMANKIFVPARRSKMIDDIKAYRHTLLEKNRLNEFKYAQGALMALSNENSPSGNALLVTICFENLRKAYSENF